jgi:hypothetical protein
VGNFHFLVKRLFLKAIRISTEYQKITAALLSSESIEHLKQKIRENSIPHLAWFKIRDNYIESFLTSLSYNKANEKRYRLILNHLNLLQRAGYKFPKCEFFVGCADYWEYPDSFSLEEIEKLPPVFVFAADSSYASRHKLILFVDDHTLGTSIFGYRRGWGKIICETLVGNDKYPWEKKDAKAFWRGTNTNREREVLVAQSEHHFSKVDAKFNTTDSSVVETVLRKNFRPIFQFLGVPPYVTIPQQLKYKMGVIIDGTTCTYPGFLYRLLSNSVVLKVDSHNEQWFYHVMIP